jgi:hypothetical protein
LCNEDPATKAVVKSAVITVVAAAAGGGIASISFDVAKGAVIGAVQNKFFSR